MPMTPLHLGLLAPINHFFPGKVSNLSFILVNLWLDAYAIALFGFGLDLGELHGPDTHSFIAALAIAGMVSCIGVLCMLWVAAIQARTTLAAGQPWPWVIGAFLGAVTHILLDAMVHSEMLPFYPAEGNPFYWGGMTWLSLILVPPLVWLIAQYVSCGVHHVEKHLEVRKLRNPEP